MAKGGRGRFRLGRRGRQPLKRTSGLGRGGGAELDPGTGFPLTGARRPFLLEFPTPSPNHARGQVWPVGSEAPEQEAAGTAGGGGGRQAGGSPPREVEGRLRAGRRAPPDSPGAGICRREKRLEGSGKRREGKGLQQVVGDAPAASGLRCPPSPRLPQPVRGAHPGRQGRGGFHRLPWWPGREGGGGRAVLSPRRSCGRAPVPSPAAGKAATQPDTRSLPWSGEERGRALGAGRSSEWGVFSGSPAGAAAAPSGLLSQQPGQRRRGRLGRKRRRVLFGAGQPAGLPACLLSSWSRPATPRQGPPVRPTGNWHSSITRQNS